MGWLLDSNMQRYILFILFISLIYPRSADWDADTVHTSLLSYKVELFSDGYVIPWGMSFLPDGDLLVSDISGKIYRVNRNGEKKAMISGVPKVFYKGQGGMLDVEVHPEFEKNNLVYFSFSDLNGKSSFTSIARAELKANSLVGLQIIYKAPKEYFSRKRLHFGSRILFDNQFFYLCLNQI